MATENKTVRRNRELRESKITIATKGQIKEANIPQLSPSYIQKEYTKLRKTMNDAQRNALEETRKKYGYTKADIIFYERLVEKQDKVRKAIETQMTSDAKNVKNKYHVDEITDRHKRLKAGPFDPNTFMKVPNIDAVPNYRGLADLVYSRQRINAKNKNVVKNIIENETSVYRWNEKTLKQIRDKLKYWTEAKWGLTERTKNIQKAISHLNNQQLVRFFFDGDNATGEMTVIQELYEDEEQADVFPDRDTDEMVLDKYEERLLDYKSRHYDRNNNLLYQTDNVYNDDLTIKKRGTKKYVPVYESGYDKEKLYLKEKNGKINKEYYKFLKTWG